MSDWTKKIGAVINGESLPANERDFEAAIKLASFVQGIRIGWGPPTQYGAYLDNPEMKPIVEGYKFPDAEMQKGMIDLFDQFSANGNYPWPKSPEVEAYHAFVNRISTVHERCLLTKEERDARQARRESLKYEKEIKERKRLIAKKKKAEYALRLAESTFGKDSKPYGNVSDYLDQINTLPNTK